jgi:hypothetical protein
MNITDKWIKELHILERLQSMSNPNYINYKIRAAEIELIKKFIQSLNK